MSIYIHDSVSFKVIVNLWINSVDIESLSVEMSLNNTRITLVNVLCRPRDGRIESFKDFKSNVIELFVYFLKDCHQSYNDFCDLNFVKKHILGPY